MIYLALVFMLTYDVRVQEVETITDGVFHSFHELRVCTEEGCTSRRVTGPVVEITPGYTMQLSDWGETTRCVENACQYVTWPKSAPWVCFGGHCKQVDDDQYLDPACAGSGCQRFGDYQINVDVIETTKPMTWFDHLQKWLGIGLKEGESWCIKPEPEFQYWEYRCWTKDDTR